MYDKLDTANAIAIIGMSIRAPGAASVDQFWDNVKQKRESISFFSTAELIASGLQEEVINASNYVKARGIVENIDMFDAGFFGFTPREAQITDPQHRLLLECAWEALEDAGHNPDGASIGVYAGVPLSTYLFKNLLPNPQVIQSTASMQLLVANVGDHVSTKISYRFNMRGPSVSIGTACSTSLVAVHLACRSLLFFECDMALAGGVCLMVPQKAGYEFEDGSIMSRDGHCRAFDARANGTVGGSGAGMVLLKRLQDAIADHDPIRAVILGSAINNDGSCKVGYTAPSPEGQCRVIKEALAMAETDPATIDYVEAHGTGTELGDPIEISALTQAFQSRSIRKRPCAIGSVKPNIGHLDMAAGVAGLIKTVLSLEHRQIAPTLHFESLNPKIRLNPETFFVNHQLRDWIQAEDHPRRAGVSSFGIGGTNSHVVLQEAEPRRSEPSLRTAHLLLLSAKSEKALESMALNLASYLEAFPELSLADVAHTLSVGRKKFEHRRAMVCSDLNDAISVLRGKSPKRTIKGVKSEIHSPVIFLFPGQGAQYAGMGRGLFETEPLFRQTVSRCAEILEPLLGLDLRTILYPEPDKTEAATATLRQTRFTQPALFVTEYALARLWMEWGLRPDAMLGHSLGEIVAACLAEVFSLEDALKLVELRGKLMQSMPEGSMLMVQQAEAEIKSWLSSGLSLAAVNSPGMCVVSGPAENIQELAGILEQEKVHCTPLHTSHAFHSSMMDPITAPFARALRKIKMEKPRIRFFSNVTGEWIKESEAVNPDYWAKQLRHTVRFWDALRQITGEPGSLLVEVGPSRTLATLARESGCDAQVFGSLRHPKETDSDETYLRKNAGVLWAIRAVDSPHPAYTGEVRLRLHLPTYPFDRQRHWVDAMTQPAAAPVRTASESVATVVTQPPVSDSEHQFTSWNEMERKVADIWQEVLGFTNLTPNDNFFDLGGDSLQATQILARCRREFDIALPARVFFESPVLSALAEAIVLEQLVATNGLELEQALNEIKNLSEDELREELLSEKSEQGQAERFK
jgi:phthiocerol/phenolphthiocerol synthesis type-I polyketide synthase E